MKVKFLFLAILGGLAFCSCNSYGDKYKLSDKHSVYYKGGGVTEDDAKKVGAYFTEIGLFTTENTMDVQISAEKNSNDMKIRYVVDKSKVTPEAEAELIKISSDMAGKLYPGKALDVILTDSKFEDIKDLGVAKVEAPRVNNPDVNQTGDEK